MSTFSNIPYISCLSLDIEPNCIFADLSTCQHEILRMRVQCFLMVKTVLMIERVCVCV